MNQISDYLAVYGWHHYARKSGVSDLSADGVSNDDLKIGRVAVQYNRTYLVASSSGLVQADGPSDDGLGARLAPVEIPAVGDWVLVSGEDSPGCARRILRVLPRYGTLSRSAAGKETKKQVLAANIDVVFIVTALDNDFSAGRIGRFRVIAAEAGASAVVLLNKADAANPGFTARALAEAEEASGGAPVRLISAKTGLGMDFAPETLGSGMTAVLAGSSGVGKSTIVNLLLGEAAQQTAEVRESDSKGRHTTVRRELLPLPGGGLIIDSPGVRELKLWASEDSLNAVFEDIDGLTEGCRFSDCTHNGEPGCAVCAALEAGTLSPARYNEYLKMRRELAFLETRRDEQTLRLEKAKWKRFSKQIKEYYRIKQGKRA